MIIRYNERQRITDILRDELDKANRRINERLAEYECVPASNLNNDRAAIRHFYQDLVDKEWTAADEECLHTLDDLSESEIKRMMREGFRRSRVYPVPSFASLIKVMKKGGDEANLAAGRPLGNLDAISAVERERLANLLFDEMVGTADELSSRLNLSDAKAQIVREQLEILQGQIVSRFTPLV
jgi:hypothetical protein